MRALLVLLLLAAGARARAEDRPTRAALRNAFEGNLRSVVEVFGPKRRGLGVIVGAGGEVLTSVDYVTAGASTVRFGGAERAGKVVMSNAQLRVALVVLEGADFPAAPARPDGPLPKGAWLLAIQRGKRGALEPKVGQVRKAAAGASPLVETDLPIVAGSPVFDGKGRLVGLCAEAKAAGGCRVLPLPALKAHLAATGEARR